MADYEYDAELDAIIGEYMQRDRDHMQAHADAVTMVVDFISAGSAMCDYEVAA